MQACFKRSVLLLLACSFAAAAQAQPEIQSLPRPDDAPFRFDHLSLEDGLSQQTVLAIEQDKKGYMWFGTLWGLNRYDGYEFKSYEQDPDDTNSLSHSRVYEILQDRNGSFWLAVGTGDHGLDRFDPETERFTHFRYDENVPSSLSGKWVSALFEDQQGQLWIGTGWGLNRYDPETETFTRILPDPRYTVNTRAERPENLGNQIRAITEDPEGILWIGTAGGLFQYNPTTGVFTRYRHNPSDPSSLSNDLVTELYVDSEGVLWVGAWGLNKFDPVTETFSRYYMDPLAIDAGPNGWGGQRIRGRNRVMSMIEDKTGTLWVGTSGGISSGIGGSGLYRFDRQQEVFHSIITGDELRWNSIFALFEDRQGILWAGTGGGASRTDRTTRGFTPYRAGASESGGLQGQMAQGLFLDQDEALWIGSWDGILNRLDRSSRTVISYISDPAVPWTLSSGQVTAIHRDRLGMLWVGTTRGLQQLDESTGRFTRLRYDPNDSSSIGRNSISVIHEDRAGTLWIGTFGGGLNRLDSANGTFTRFVRDPADSLSIGGNTVRVIYEDPVGRMWVGGDFGVNLFDPDSGQFTRYEHDPGDLQSLSSNVLYSNTLFMDASEPGTLWVATTGGGLNSMDVATGRFNHYTAQNSGLPDNSLYCVLGDDTGSLWMSTNHGIVLFDPDIDKWTVYGMDDGLTGLEFDVFSCHRGYNGELFFGGATGVTAIWPGGTFDNPNPPQVVLTDLRLGREIVVPGPDSPLKQRLSKTSSITLSHSQNDLILGYVGLHFRNPENNRYKYILEGYDDAWSDTTDIRQASYTNLPPGDYSFRMTAANSDGIWNPEPVLLSITILPPWWRTWLAYAVYLLLAVGAVIQGYRWQHARVVRREREAARERELEQAREIERQHSELTEAHDSLKTTQGQLIQSEKLASLGQLTSGIAHELKNPLNFVNNFAEVNEEIARDLLAEIVRDTGRTLAQASEQIGDLAHGLKTNAAQIAKHGKRADAIVASMMAHATAGSGERLNVEVNGFVEEYLRLASGAFTAHRPDFDVQTVTDLAEDAGSVRMVSQELGRALVNVLSNAFEAVRTKAETAGDSYEPTVTVSTCHTTDAVEIRIFDNGSGIPADIREKIFEPFFTTKPTGEGTGLGLSLSYDIVTKGHGGTMTVGETDGGGANFTITLPCGKPPATIES